MGNELENDKLYSLGALWKTKSEKLPLSGRVSMTDRTGNKVADEITLKTGDSILLFPTGMNGERTPVYRVCVKREELKK